MPGTLRAGGLAAPSLIRAPAVIALGAPSTDYSLPAEMGHFEAGPRTCPAVNALHVALAERGTGRAAAHGKACRSAPLSEAH